MNKKALNLGRKYDEENKSRFAERPKGKFRELQLMPGEPKRVRFLHGPDQAIDLWIHFWKGKEGQRIRQLCAKAHYGEDCDVCATLNKFGDPCWASYVRVFLGYCYDNVGTTYKVKKGKNKGKEMPISPICAIDIPKGKNEQFWNTLDKAVTDDYFSDTDYCWELSKVEEVGFTKPSLLPIKALGKQVSSVVPKELLKEIAGYTEDEIAAQILNSCTGVRWELFDLEQPEAEAKSEEPDDDDDDAEEEAPPPKKTGTARKATSAASNDEDDEEAPPKKAKAKKVEEDEEEESPPPKKKKPAPVAEDDEEEETPPPKKKKVAAPVEDDEEEEAPPPKKKKPAPVVEDDEEEEAPPPKKKKPAVVEDDEEEAPPPKKKKPAPVEDDEEEAPAPKKKKPPVVEDDEEEAPPPKKKKAAPVVEDDEEEEAPPPKKKKVAAKVEDDEEEYVAPPKKKRDKLAT